MEIGKLNNTARYITLAEALVASPEATNYCFRATQYGDSVFLKLGESRGSRNGYTLKVPVLEIRRLGGGLFTCKDTLCSFNRPWVFHPVKNSEFLRLLGLHVGSSVQRGNFGKSVKLLHYLGYLSMEPYKPLKPMSVIQTPPVDQPNLAVKRVEYRYTISSEGTLQVDLSEQLSVANFSSYDYPENPNPQTLLAYVADKNSATKAILEVAKKPGDTGTVDVLFIAED